MQIGPHGLLSFLPGSTQQPPALSGPTDTSDGTPATAASTPRAALPLLQDAVADETGVVLRLQSDAPDANVPRSDLVYGRTPRFPADAGTEAEDAVADDARRAAQYQEALQRSAGNSTTLSVDADGVLLATPASPEEIKSRQFMHFAVTTMREYAEAQERQKHAASQDGGAAGSTLIPRSLAEVQKLAARFRLFA